MFVEVVMASGEFWNLVRVGVEKKLNFSLGYGQEVLDNPHIWFAKPIILYLFIVFGIVEGIVAILAAEEILQREVPWNLFQKGENSLRKMVIFDLNHHNLVLLLLKRSLYHTEIPVSYLTLLSRKIVH